MLHSDTQGRSASPAPHAKSLAPLLTSIDRALPIGRCVGVALPLALTAEVVRAAKEELMPEEMSYCLGLPPALQVGVDGMMTAVVNGAGLFFLGRLSVD